MNFNFPPAAVGLPVLAPKICRQEIEILWSIPNRFDAPVLSLLLLTHCIKHNAFQILTHTHGQCWQTRMLTYKFGRRSLRLWYKHKHEQSALPCINKSNLRKTEQCVRCKRKLTTFTRGGRWSNIKQCCREMIIKETIHPSSITNQLRERTVPINAPAR